MAVLAFDTYHYVKTLRNAGLPETQAEAHADALKSLIEQNIATKQDLLDVKRELKQDISNLRNEVKQDISDLGQKLIQDNLQLRSDTRAALTKIDAKIDTKIEASQKTIIKWMIGLFISQIGLTIALIKIL